MRPGDIGDGADRLPGPRESAKAPIDLDAVRADDDLIEALAAGLVPPPTGRPATDDVGEQLVALLAGWVADVRPETLLHQPGDPPPPDLGATKIAGTRPAAEHALGAPVVAEPDTVGTPLPVRAFAEPGAEPDPAAAEDEPGLATAPISATVRSIPAGRHRLRRTGPARTTRFAAAAVLVVLAGSGVVAGAWGAKPGTALWPVTQIVFAQKARSVQAATDVTNSLERARTALKNGRSAEAQAALAVVLAQLPDVADADGHDVLAAQTSEVGQQLVSDSSTVASSTDEGRTVLASGSAGAAITTAPAFPDRSRAASELPPAAAALPGTTTGTGTTSGTGTTADAASGGTTPGDTSSGTAAGGSVADAPPPATVTTTTPPPPTSVVPPPPVTTEPPPPSPSPSPTPADPGTSGGVADNATPSDTTAGGTGSGGSGSSGSTGSPSGGGSTGSGGSGGSADSSGSGSSGGSSNSSSGGSGSPDGSSNSSSGGSGSSDGSSNGSSGGGSPSALGAAAGTTTGTIDTIAGVLS